MATYPYSHFALTDPVAAQQVVSMAQIAQQEQAERDRARVGTLSAITQGNVARDNAAQQRAYSQSQLMESQRQFDSTDTYRNKALGVNEALAIEDAKLRRNEELRKQNDAIERERYRVMESIMLGDDPPTDLEFTSKTEGLSPERRDLLNQLRAANIKARTDQAATAERAAARWQARFDEAVKLGPASALAIGTEFDKHPEREFIENQSGRFVSRIRRPRTDPVYGPSPESGAAINARVMQAPSQPGLGDRLGGMMGGLMSRLFGPSTPASSVPVTHPSLPMPPRPPPAPLPQYPYDPESAVRSYLPQYPPQ